MSEPLRQSDPPAPVIIPPPRPAPHLVLATDSHPDLPRLQRFIETRFEAAYGAQLTGHYPRIAALMDGEGEILAAAGIRFAEDEPLFLEGYLDEPVDQAIAAAFGRPVSRDSVAEIGSFASDSPAASLELFGALAAWLSGTCGRRYAVATARPELARMLDRSGFGLRRLADADPDRLGAGAARWGTYYDRGPQVFAGEIGLSAALPLLRQRLRAKVLARQVRRLRRTAP